MREKTACYTLEELIEALRAINFIINKCVKTQAKFSEGNSHHTLLHNRLKAMNISESLIADKLAEMSSAPKQVLKECEECRAEAILSHLNLLCTTDLGQSASRKTCTYIQMILLIIAKSR